MDTGQKVICIDAGANNTFPEYQSPLIKDNVYVVRAVVPLRSGKIGIQLIGVALPPAWTNQSFAPERFRLLDELKALNKQKKQEFA